jgi:hypothetical protein
VADDRVIGRIGRRIARVVGCVIAMRGTTAHCHRTAVPQIAIFPVVSRQPEDRSHIPSAPGRSVRAMPPPARQNLAIHPFCWMTRMGSCGMRRAICRIFGTSP